MKLEIEVLELEGKQFRVMNKRGDLILAREITFKRHEYGHVHYFDNGCWTLIHKVDTDHYTILAKNSKRNFEKFIQKVGDLFDE